MALPCIVYMKIAQELLLVFYSNYGLYTIKQDAVKIGSFYTPHAFGTPVEGHPIEILP